MPDPHLLKLPKEITDAHNISLDGSQQSSASKRGDNSASIRQQSSEFNQMNQINVVHFGARSSNMHGSSDIEAGGLSIYDQTPELGDGSGVYKQQPVAAPQVHVAALDTPGSGDVADETPLVVVDEAIRE